MIGQIVRAVSAPWFHALLRIFSAKSNSLMVGHKKANLCWPGSGRACRLYCLPAGFHLSWSSPELLTAQLSAAIVILRLFATSKSFQMHHFLPALDICYTYHHCCQRVGIIVLDCLPTIQWFFTSQTVYGSSFFFGSLERSSPLFPQLQLRL